MKIIVDVAGNETTLVTPEGFDNETLIDLLDDCENVAAVWLDELPSDWNEEN